MIPIWIGKMVAKRVIKAIKHKIDLNKIDKYVNKPNELDLQAKAHARALDRYGRTIEELEIDVAILKKKSSCSCNKKNDYKKIVKRLNKLEKKEK